MSIDNDKYFMQGIYAKVRKSRFDSESEEKICLILNHILKDYSLDKFMQIRLIPQQALDNYVEVKNEKFREYYKNKHKWMKFDFIFEEVYEYKNRMNYIPVAVVEFDGPYHKTDEQKKLDNYKNGIVSNIGAGMVRIEYDKLNSLDENEVRYIYEKDIIMEIIKGYFTKTVNNRKSEFLINKNNNKRFKHIVLEYEKASKSGEKNSKYYDKMLVYLYSSKDIGFTSAN